MINALKLLISLIIFSQISSAQVGYDWEYPTFISEEELGHSIMDVNSNIYMIKRFNDSVSIGDTILHTSLEQGVYVSKYDINHEFVWAKLIAEARVESADWQSVIRGFNLKLDEIGNIYPLIYYTDSTYINNVLYTVDRSMILPVDNALIKLNENGDFVDINHFKGSCNTQLGDVVIENEIYYQLNFGKHDTEVLDSCSCVINGDTTIYSTMGRAMLGKIANSGGTPDWEREVNKQGNSGVRLSKLVKTPSNIYVAGSVSNSLDLVYDSDTLVVPGYISYYVFIMKLDLDGNKIWWQYSGVDNWDSHILPSELIVNTEDDILLVTGSFNQSTLHQIHLSNSPNLVGHEWANSCSSIINYSGIGTVKWKDIHCGNNYQPIRGVDVNSENEILTWGNHSYHLIIGADSIILSDSRPKNYILEYSISGEKTIVDHINSPRSVRAYHGIFVDQFDDLHVVGRHSDTLMQLGSIDIPFPPHSDRYFIAKLRKHPLSVFSEEEVDELIIYPNPSFGQFFLKLKNAKIREVEVFNMLGEKMNIQSYYNGSNEINLVDLVKGMYIIKVTSTSGAYSQRKVLIE